MSYRSAIIEFYRRNPEATQVEVRKGTGASQSMVRYVYGQLVAAGTLRRSPQAEAKARAYGLPPSRYGERGANECEVQHSPRRSGAFRRRGTDSRTGLT